MSINATADGVIYSGIDTINAGGKNITLSEEYTGTKQITSNGTHDVSGYKNAEVNVNGAAKLQFIFFIQLAIGNIPKGLYTGTGTNEILTHSGGNFNRVPTDTLKFLL